MKPSGKLYICPISGKETAVLHEIFFGNGVRVEYGIEYNLQIPVDPITHKLAHGETVNGIKGNKKEYQKKFCEYLGINFQRTKLAVNMSDKQYLESIKMKCAEKIASFER